MEWLSLIPKHLINYAEFLGATCRQDRQLTTQAGNKSLSKHNTLNDIFYYNLL